MKTSQPTTATKPLLVTYPLPWHVVADCISPRLVADNNATILAVNSEELPIIRYIAAIVNGTTRAEAQIAHLVGVLSHLDHYKSADDFVDDLIMAAEAVIQTVSPTSA